MNAIKPLAETAETVTLSRADYEALIDVADLAALRDVEAKLAAGEAEDIPIEMVERLLAGEHPLRVWREHRGLTGPQLARMSGVPQSYISEIETKKKPGSVDAMTKLAHAMGLSIDDIVPVPGQ
ncbi:MAG: helix-turn-helix transcriptional regulator [Alphaproteobacteria bacterium]|nr:helix-turn-helix transcriptional regulator [Alphaproteobacteria bacterium]